MRLFMLEMKRLVKTRRTLILVFIALVFSVIMAYLPVSFESINRPGEDGSIVELDGLEALQFKKNYYRKTNGEVTPEKVAEALRIYQSYVREYGTLDEVPLDLYVENILAVRPVLQGLSEAFADPKTGIGTDLMKINPDEVEESYYEKCRNHLNDIMNLEQKKYPAPRQYAADKYSKVEVPFQLYTGVSRDAFDYTELYILVLMVLCTAIAAPIFANEYQTGSDNIFRCAKYGRMRFAVVRITASCCIFIAVFILGMAIHLTILNLAFGTECLKTSMQMLFSIINLPNMNLGQLQLTLAVCGGISLIASMSCALFLSAKCKDSLTALLISFVVLFLPIFAYFGLGGSTWLSTILPSAGIGMQNSFLYQFVDFQFLHLGKLSLWTPYVIFISAVIEIPAFLILAVRTYCRRQRL